MVGAYDSFGEPALLEKGLGARVFELDGLGFRADGALPEIVKILGGPALEVIV